MDKYYKHITWSLIVLGIFVTALLIAGPYRVNPHIAALLGLEVPSEVPPVPVPRAEEVGTRVLDAVREDGIRALMDQFVRYDSRVVGYSGHEKAADFIESEFRRFGMEDVEAETYGVAVPIDQGGSLMVEDTGEVFTIHGLWPNLVKTTTLPTGGVQGHLLWGGDGDVSEFNGRNVEGAVVLMEFNSWNNWLNAAMLGAQQIIFVEPDSTFTAQAETKFLQVPNSVERFWIDKASGEKLKELIAQKDEVNVTLKARMDWEKKETRNILGWIRGTDPVLSEKIVVINTYYDAMSVVPALAPGAEMAGGIVGLMKLAEYFSKYPPKHTLLFLASSGHHLGFRGICDFLSRHSRKEKHFAALMTEPLELPLFISLDLTSQTDEIGVWNSTRNYYYKRFFTPFGKSLVHYSEAIAERFDLDPADALIDGINPKGGMNWDMYIPGKVLKTDGEVVLEAGTPALSLITVNDARFRVDTPLDKPEHVNFKNLTGQIRLLAGVLDLGLNSEDFLPDYKLDPDDRMRGLQGFVRTFPRLSITPDRPRPGAVASLRMGNDKSIKGVRRVYYDIADENGEFYMPGIAERRVDVKAFYMDPESGEITYAPNHGRQARIYRGEFNMDWWISKRTRILFPCVATDFYDTVDPRYLTKLSSISVLGPGNTAPQEYGYAIGFGPEEPVGTIFTTPGERIKIVMREREIGVRYLLLNSKSAESVEVARGDGFQILQHGGAFIRSSFQAAKDMWTLNEARMRELEKYSIENQRMTNLHDQAKYHLDLAEEAMKDRKWDLFVKHTRAGMGLESRAYPDVKSTQNDVIRGVIFFMLLVIPCAFFVERLLFTFSDIRVQIGGFSVVFVVIWTVLAQVHPAFDLSNPFVILLAFVILALAVFVISIVSGRFHDNIRQLRTEEVLLHDTDVGRISASVAAFQLGIANMKKRKMRTSLTFATLVLLTFTVLSFTSIKTTLDFHQLPLDDTEGKYPGLLIRSQFWGPLEDTAYDYARINFFDQGEIAPRSWYVTRDLKKTPIETPEKTTKVLGIVGLSVNEPAVTGIDTLLSHGRWFEEGEIACILPGKIAGLLKVEPEDVGKKSVRLFGKQLKVVGLIDAEKMRDLKDLDGEILSPADFKLTDDEIISQMTQRESREKQGLEQPQLENMPFEHIDPDDIAIIPYKILREVGSPLQSVAIRLHEDVNVEEQVKEYVSRLSVVVYAGIPGEDGKIEVSIYSSLGWGPLPGLANLFVPILVAALIVLNTMMGSVYERFREIGIYSAVGLAPVHISFLFIAEACVYAVLGTVSGYLLGQGVIKVLLWQGWLQGLNVNYSALSTVISSALVMVVVLISSLYPARQAALMAVPDVTRRWRLPDPEGDHWHFEFPFTVGGKDVFGLSVFLVDYFESHMGESMGAFYTDGARFGSVEAETGSGYTIDTTIWLAPYDLGVSQQVHFEAVPIGEHNIFAMTLTIDRLSGDVASWRRGNQGFMNALRKQFLIWRTVDPTNRAKYTEKGRELLAAPTAVVNA
ncbi:MAG: hypothetical protein OXR71_00560 [Gemmatimonadota bacterium]|nr:hypothetical protein [Gemmatimonadota bacterium]